jgi:hypothetical protein
MNKIGLINPWLLAAAAMLALYCPKRELIYGYL